MCKRPKLREDYLLTLYTFAAIILITDYGSN